jgi:hypothetical protein
LVDDIVWSSEPEVSWCLIRHPVPGGPLVFIATLVVRNVLKVAEPSGGSPLAMDSLLPS